LLSRIATRSPDSRTCSAAAGGLAVFLPLHVHALFLFGLLGRFPRVLLTLAETSISRSAIVLPVAGICRRRFRLDLALLPDLAAGRRSEITVRLFSSCH
jgi:hypothetical protein